MNRKKLNFKRFVGLYIYASATSVKKIYIQNSPWKKYPAKCPCYRYLSLYVYIYIYFFFFEKMC